jgi:hypothetical protein
LGFCKEKQNKKIKTTYTGNAKKIESNVGQMHSSRVGVPIPNMHALILLYVIYFKIDLLKYLIEILS